VKNVNSCTDKSLDQYDSVPFCSYHTLSSKRQMLNFENYHTILWSFSYIHHRFFINPEYHEPFLSASPKEVSRFSWNIKLNWHSKYYTTAFEILSSLTPEAILNLSKIKINSSSLPGNYMYKNQEWNWSIKSHNVLLHVCTGHNMTHHA
jgi:hypothetical protein